MIVPFSSRGSRAKERRLTGGEGIRRIPYVPTALAYKILPEENGDGLREGKMGFLDHLDELRRRIIRSIT